MGCLGHHATVTLLWLMDCQPTNSTILLYLGVAVLPTNSTILLYLGVAVLPTIVGVYWLRRFTGYFDTQPAQAGTGTGDACRK